MFFNFFKKKSVGIDLCEVSRFVVFNHSKDHSFLKKTFLEEELVYCFSFEDPSTHLAGMFAAKEAVSKALGTGKYPFIEVEIRHEANGKPQAFFKGKKLEVEISISHTNDIACAIAIG